MCVCKFFYMMVSSACKRREEEYEASGENNVDGDGIFMFGAW